MNLVLLHPEDFVAGQRARLVGRRLRHLREVHRAAVGRALRVGVADGLMGRGVVSAIDDEAAILDVTLDEPPPAPLPLVLVLALPRPKVLNRTLAACASLGVKELHLVNAWRVEKGYWSSPRLASGNVRDQLELGLEQARDTVLPRIASHRLFRAFSEDTLPGLCAGRAALFADPDAPDECPRGIDGPALVAIGPEGGFIDAERASLVRAGLRPVRLGPRVLRVETAVAAIVGRLY